MVWEAVCTRLAESQIYSSCVNETFFILIMLHNLRSRLNYEDPWAVVISAQATKRQAVDVAFDEKDCCEILERSSSDVGVTSIEYQLSISFSEMGLINKHVLQGTMRTIVDLP